MIGKRLRQWPEGLMHTGEYAKHSDGTWYAMAPNGVLVWLKNHMVAEHEDGTITVSPGFTVAKDTDNEWQGYLERGAWRQR